jgi:hypothetical protein
MLFWDDFSGALDFNTTTGLAKWLFLETGGSGSAKTIDYTQSVGGGVLNFTQSNTDNDVMTLISNWSVRLDQLQAGLPLRFGARFKTPATANDFDFFIGLVGAQDTSMVAGFNDGVTFRVQEGTAGLDIVSKKDNATASAETNFHTLANSTWARAGFEINRRSDNADSGTVNCAVHHNGTVTRPILSVTDNIPEDEPLSVVIQWQAGNASAETMLFDWVYVHGIRADYVAGTG